VDLPSKEVFPETSKARFTSKGGFCGQDQCPVTVTRVKPQDQKGEMT
jgi:hypothetical protein